MAKVTGGVHRRCKSEMMEISDRSCSLVDTHEFHVLAVDDSFVDRKVIERLLKISSCKVTVVDSGQRALKFLGLDEEKKSSLESNGLKVHLIITDYSMPGMTGYELLKRIKESSMFREVPVVIMSSENILGRIASCLEEGAKEYIVKPVKLTDVERLKEVIKTSHLNGIEGNESFKLSIPQTENPVVVENLCSSPECFCMSTHPRFPTRSSKHHSRVSPQ